MLKYQSCEWYCLISAVRKGKVGRVRKLLKSYSQAWPDGYVLFREALAKKHTEVAKLLLTNGSEVNSKTKNSNTPLHFAAISGDIDIVQMLLDRGAKVNARNKRGDTPLHNAVKSKKLEIVELLINRGANVNTSNRSNIDPLDVAIQVNAVEIVKFLLSIVNFPAKDPRGAAYLHIAAKKGFLPIVKYFVEHGAYDNCTYTSVSPERYTPLQLAIVYKHESVVMLLLKHEADIDAQNKLGQTILNFAVESGQSAIVEHILKRCPAANNESNRSALNIAVHGNEKQYNKIVNNLLQYGISVNPEHGNNSKLLLAAVQKGYLPIVEDLLKSDVNILCNSTFINDSMLLHVATKYGRVEVAKLLISYGADVNAQDKTGNTPTYYAIENADLKMIQLLLTNEANVKDNPEFLNTAVTKKCRNIIEILLEHGADINASSKYGITALHCTALHKCRCLSKSANVNNINKGIVKLLLSRGANVNAQTNSGITILHAAVYDPNVKVVKLVLEYNVDVNSTYKDDITPLHLSARNGHKVINEMLLNKGANINAKQNDGRTALHIATQGGHQKVVEVLLKRGARIDSKTKKGTTPLHIAAETGDLEILELLLKFGADIDSRNECGETALHIASTEACTEIVIALLDHGSDVTIMTEDSYTALDIAKAGIESFYSRYDSDSDIFDHSMIAHETIAEVLKCHMIKLKTANLYACNQNVLSITASDEDELLSYFQDECEKEIASMKSEKIDANISFYNILTKGISQLAIYAGNESVVQVLRSGDYKRKFRIYASTINTHFKNGERRKELLEQGAEIFHFFFNFLGLPHVCAERIFNCLSDEDLRTLMDACEPISRYQQS